MKKTINKKTSTCEFCKKDKPNVVNRPTRVGVCNYCEDCYDIQILMS